MGFVLVDDSKAEFRATGATVDHLCAADRPILIRSYPQGGDFVTVWVCDACYPEWADADLSASLS